MSHSVSSILSQIRSLHEQMPQEIEAPRGHAGYGSGIEGITATDKPAPPSFVQTLRRAMEGVNDAQQHASSLSAAFERGEPGADLAQVMVAAQQAQVAFRATVEVRNRLVQAYQDVLNMPI